LPREAEPGEDPWHGTESVAQRLTAAANSGGGGGGGGDGGGEGGGGDGGGSGSAAAGSSKPIKISPLARTAAAKHAAAAALRDAEEVAAEMLPPKPEPNPNLKP
jgi:hypothetical protein